MTLIWFLSLLCVLLGLITLLGLFARHSWIGTLCVQFRPHYALLLMLVGVGFFLQNQWRGGAAAIAFALVNLVDVLPTLSWSSSIDRGDVATSTRLFFANVNSTNSLAESISSQIISVQPSVVVLIEVSPTLNHDLEATFSDQFQFESYHLYRGEEFGLKFMSKHDPIDMILYDDGKMIGPILIAALLIDGNQVNIVVTHPLSPERRSWMKPRREALMKGAELAQELEGEVIFVGDMNATPWDPVYRDLRSVSGLRDARKGFGYIGTWPRLFPPLMIPLDHALVSEKVTVQEFKRGSNLGSDHWPLILNLRIGE